PARARVDRVGVRTVRRAYAANHVQFEGSLDGTTWKPIATITAAMTDTPQWFNATPTDASFLRVTMVDGRQPDVRLHSILAGGSELEPPRPGPIEGCWSFNGKPAYFERRGTRILGVVTIGNQP